MGTWAPTRRGKWSSRAWPSYHTVSSCKTVRGLSQLRRTPQLQNLDVGCIINAQTFKKCLCRPGPRSEALVFSYVVAFCVDCFFYKKATFLPPVGVDVVGE